VNLSKQRCIFKIIEILYQRVKRVKGVPTKLPGQEFPKISCLIVKKEGGVFQFLFLDKIVANFSFSTPRFIMNYHSKINYNFLKHHKAACKEKFYF
jgi:hypothetical protein